MTSVDRIQGLSGSLAVKAPVRAATTAAITLSGEQTVDGVAVVEGDRVLVKDQASAVDNGIYDVSTGGWTRALDFNGANDAVKGTLVSVAEGAANAVTLWRFTQDSPVFGVDAVSFAALDFSGLLPTLGLPSGASLVGYDDTVATSYLKTVSDILNGSEVSFHRFIPRAQLAAITDGTSTYDVLAAFNDASDAFTVKGFGDLYIPRGRYNLSDEVVVEFDGRLRGAGADATEIRSTSTTANHFRLGYSGRTEFTGLGFTTSVTKTGGAGIRVEGVGGTNAQETRINKCVFISLYIGINMANATYWSITENMIGESVLYGVAINNTFNFDAGDNYIAGNTIYRTGVTAGTSGVFHEASGGLKMIGNKVLGHAAGYRCSPRSGCTYLIDAQLLGNSIENCTTGIILETPNAATSIGQFNLNGNQIATLGTGISLTGVVNGGTVSGNTISVNYASGIGIYADTVSGGTPGQVNVVGNLVTGNSSALSVGIYGKSADIACNANNINGCVTTHSNMLALWTGERVSFAVLTASAAVDGSVVFCIDGTVANPVAGGGTGCLAKRIAGAWVGN